MKTSVARLLAILMIIGLALRLATGIWWQAQLGEGIKFGFGDSATYWELAKTIAFGLPYEYGPDGAQIFRTPGYPTLLSPIFLMTGNETSVLYGRAVSAVFGTLTIAVLFWLGRELFGTRAGLLAGAIATFYPGAVAMGALVLTEATFGFMMSLQLAIWVAASQEQSTRRSIGLAIFAGFIAGFATMLRPSWLLFTPFAILAALIASRARIRHLSLGIAMMLGLALIMAPWCIRNARLTGHFVPTTLQVGASLYDGLNPNATGASDMAFVEKIANEERQSNVESSTDESFEYRLDRRFRTAALDWANSHKSQAAYLAGVKFLRLWNIWPNEKSLSNPMIRLAICLTFTPIVALAIVCAFRTIRFGWPYILCWLPAVYFTVLHVVFVGSIRYRQPPMLLLIVLAAGLLTWGKCEKTNSDTPKTSKI